KTASSGSVAPVLEDEALAPTRTPAGRRTSATTAPGRQSVITQAPAEEMRVLAAALGARRPPAAPAPVGPAGLPRPRGIAPPAARAPPAGPRPPPPPPHPATPPPPPPVGARAPAPPEPPAAVVAPGPPGFLVVKAQPWGRLFVDGKFAGDVEGSRRFPLAPGSHILRLVNGKKARPWTVEIASGKAVTREHSFLEGGAFFA